MSIYEYDEQQHMDFVKEEGREVGRIEGTLETLIELGMDKAAVRDILAEKFSISQEEADEYIEKYDRKGKGKV